MTREVRDYIATRTPFDYVWTDDWSPRFYRTQARLGFIAVAHQGPDSAGNVLTPQLQHGYAILDWPDLAGELGYAVGRAYVSLSGFFRRERPEWNHFGKLQMVLLARRLEAAGFAFWNLGHPSMGYKTRLGARFLPRADFLPRWDAAAEGDVPNLGTLLCKTGESGPPIALPPSNTTIHH